MGASLLALAKSIYYTQITDNTDLVKTVLKNENCFLFGLRFIVPKERGAMSILNSHRRLA